MYVCSVCVCVNVCVCACVRVCLPVCLSVHINTFKQYETKKIKSAALTMRTNGTHYRSSLSSSLDPDEIPNMRHLIKICTVYCMLLC